MSVGVGVGVCICVIVCERDYEQMNYTVAVYALFLPTDRMQKMTQMTQQRLDN